MARQPTDGAKRVSFQVSTAQRPEFKQPLAAYVFDAQGKFADRVEVRDGKVELPLSPDALGRARVFIAPVDAKLEPKGLTAAQLERLGAYEPVLLAGGRLIDRIDIAGPILDIWPFCFCWVRGKVVRAGDNRPVCDARVHICEVDRIPFWILKLPDPDIFRLRDDLIEVLRNPPLPGPGPEPFRPDVARAALRAADDRLSRVALNPQPLPPRRALRFADAPLSRVALNPAAAAAARGHRPAAGAHARLRSRSSLVVREALVQNWKLLLPWFCLWRHWWWWFVATRSG